ncbi:hypothetical protein, conserved [Trypanosoma brucei brucei TREU927]|uniref:Uncharacterized protein n=1 Tax=Trypanosoma brucei brucei (strain 927/4 GUTat10.1) TaxID=185431 RepID=Q581Q6_TRYB2|nr:hypothetical protein, conserved [Trypanosoma brucei brucei TREU927]AAX79914.1 hypothetical protein, conserved [Trypanosoma brucei]AAZ10766.1 hypothetical protein, conserved [Trypanosoma brucei brucei TREU927]
MFRGSGQASTVLGGASYTRNEVVYEPLPKNDKHRLRRREVERFRRAPLPPLRPRWNASVADEAHPFPQRPLMHTLEYYKTDEQMMCEAGFLDSIVEKPRSTVVAKWHPETTKVASHASTAARSCTPLSNRSFLERVFQQESVEQKVPQWEWVPSTLTGTIPRHTFRGIASKFAGTPVSFPTVHGNEYVNPPRRVQMLNELIREKKRSKRAPSKISALPHVGGFKVPHTFKMSNIDEWWPLDPTIPLRAPKEPELNATVTSREMSASGSR